MIQWDSRDPSEVLTPDQRWVEQDRIARRYLESFRIVVCSMRGRIEGDLHTSVDHLYECETVEDALRWVDMRLSLGRSNLNRRIFLERKGKKGHRDPQAIRLQRLRG